jgi:branched-subunit amino acid ABC-type transport system permease component
VTSLLPYLISGLVAGSLYGLAGLGLVLTYRTSGVFNFGHGAIAAGGAFMFYTLHVTHGIVWPVAALLTVVIFAAVVGTVLEFITRPFSEASDAVIVVGTVGLLLGTEGVLYLIYGDSTINSPTFLPQSGFQLDGVQISWAEVISFLVAAGVASGLYIFLRYSRSGVAMRAVVDNPRLVSLSGDRPVRIRRRGWILGCAVAAIAGILLSPVLNLDVNLLTLLVIQAFGACAIGAFSSLPLTFAGGLIVGVLSSVFTKWFTVAPFTGIPASVPFLVLFVMLLVLPVAKLPGSRFGRRALVAAAPKVATSSKAIGIVALLVVAAFIPSMVGTKLPVWTTAVAYVLVFASLGMLTWGSGQISLCHASFLALGTTTMSHLTAAHVPWLLALVISGLSVIPAGAVVAIPALRLSGIYLALATLGFGIFLQNVIYPSKLMFGLQLNALVPRPKLGPIDASSDKTLYYVMVIVVAVFVALILALQRGRFGRVLRALAESPTMLFTHGLSVNLTRLMVFCLSAFFAGVGGALVVTQTGVASGVTFGPIQSMLLLAVLGICGTTRLVSPIIAALMFGVLPSYVTGLGADRQLLAFGIAALVAAYVIAQRRGIWSRIGHMAATSDFRRNPAPWTQLAPKRNRAARPSRHSKDAVMAE